MEKKLTGNSIVIINTGIDPQSFNSYWLVKNGILKEEELSLEHIFTKQFVLLNCEKYEILINANSFQFQLKNNDLNNINFLIEKILKFNEVVKNTINISLGINFNWILDIQKGEYIKLSKDLFFIKTNPLHSKFDVDNACFGTYLSKDFNKSRLKLDIKPILLSEDILDGSINFNFNFHFDLPVENKSDYLKDIVDSWESYYKESEDIVNTI